jgi:glycolate oxidase FAD binding subunit
MTEALKPRDGREVEAAVLWALQEQKTLEIVGHGSKRAIGRAAQWDATLDLSGLSGVTLYEPEELVLSAKAGTPIAEIETLLASRGQALAFEPMDYGPLLGLPAGRGTLGGALSANLSGPRRIKAGAARDHVLGFTGVTGRGETIKSGGRVVKNVTGYDLSKLICGAWGTLAAITDVTVKVLPRAETEETLTISGADEQRAMQVMSVAMGSACDVSAAAHLPGVIASRVLGSAPAHGGITALRLEGIAPSIAHRRQRLEALIAPFGAAAILAEPSSRAFWRSVRDVAPFAANGPRGDWLLWRISIAPASGADLARLISPVETEMFFDWAGGLVWLALPPRDDGGADLVRRATRGLGGHATLVRAPNAVRAAVEVFEPQEPALAALTKRVKEGFDPQRVLNAGRMYAGV